MIPYSINELDNGLKVALLPTKSKVVYCGFAIHSGSRNDPETLPGMAHFVEHTIFKGTQKRKAWHIINRMERVGGELNAFTTKETTFVYTVAPRNELRRSIELLNDLIRHATFPTNELTKEKTVIEDEINIYKDTPSDEIFDRFDQLFFEGTSLAHPILGSQDSLKRISQKDCLRYVHDAFRPSRMLFFCMGQVSPQRYGQLTEELLTEAFPKTGNKYASNEQPKVSFFERKEDSDTHQAHTLIGGIAPSLLNEQRTEANLIMSILAGNGMNSRLNIRLREQKGWVYGVEASTNTLPDIGWWQIYFGSDPINAEKALETTLEEVRRLTSEPLTPTALRAWIKQVKGEATMATEQSESVFLNFGRQLLLKGYYEDITQLFEKLDAVTSDSIMVVANQLFSQNNISKLIYLGK